MAPPPVCAGFSSALLERQVDRPLSEQNLPWREKVLVAGPDVMFEVGIRVFGVCTLATCATCERKTGFSEF